MTPPISPRNEKMKAFGSVQALSRPQMRLGWPSMENEPSQSGQQDASPQEERKPWPMWPIVLAIFSFIVFYTWVQLSFRKEERPYEPSQAMSERAAQATEKNLYDWYSLNTTRTNPSEELSSSGILARKLAGPLENDLPSQIVYYIPRKPILVPKLESVAADAAFTPEQPITIRLTLPEAFGESPDFRLAAFYKDGDLRLLAEMRVENEEDLARFDPESPPKAYHFAIETGPIEVDKVAAKLYFEGQIREWSIIREADRAAP